MRKVHIEENVSDVRVCVCVGGVCVCVCVCGLHTVEGATSEIFLKCVIHQRGLVKSNETADSDSRTYDNS